MLVNAKTDKGVLVELQQISMGYKDIKDAQNMITNAMFRITVKIDFTY